MKLPLDDAITPRKVGQAIFDGLRTGYAKAVGKVTNSREVLFQLGKVVGFWVGNLVKQSESEKGTEENGSTDDNAGG